MEQTGAPWTLWRSQYRSREAGEPERPSYNQAQAVRLTTSYPFSSRVDSAYCRGYDDQSRTSEINPSQIQSLDYRKYDAEHYDSIRRDALKHYLGPPTKAERWHFKDIWLVWLTWLGLSQVQNLHRPSNQ